MERKEKNKKKKKNDEDLQLKYRLGTLNTKSIAARRWVNIMNTNMAGMKTDHNSRIFSKVAKPTAHFCQTSAFCSENIFITFWSNFKTGLVLLPQ